MNRLSGIKGSLLERLKAIDLSNFSEDAKKSIKKVHVLAQASAQGYKLDSWKEKIGKFNKQNRNKKLTKKL